MWDEAAAKFVFSIGEVVIHKTTAHHGKTALRFVVVERSLSQCHGGIQRHYVLRAVFQEGEYSRRQSACETMQSTVNETELLPAPAAEGEVEKLERVMGDLNKRAEKLA